MLTSSDATSSEVNDAGMTVQSIVASAPGVRGRSGGIHEEEEEEDLAGVVSGEEATMMAVATAGIAIRHLLGDATCLTCRLHTKECEKELTGKSGFND
jgi:hypothetical protein